MSGYVTRRLAAETIGCSVRTVERLVERQVLTSYAPRGAQDEQVPLLLLGSEVLDVAAVALRLDRVPTKEDMANVRVGTRGKVKK